MNGFLKNGIVEVLTQLSNNKPSTGQKTKQYCNSILPVIIGFYYLHT